MPLAEAKALGAMSLFGEKYGDVVRVVEIGGEFSRELCGGTHVGSSAEIGSLTLLTESSVGSGNRRVEALVGLDSFNHLAAERTLVNQLTGLMKVQSSADLPEKINQTLSKLKAAEKELAQLRRESCRLRLASCWRTHRPSDLFAFWRMTLANWTLTAFVTWLWICVRASAPRLRLLPWWCG